MKYDRFEQLPVWQTAIELAERVYKLTRNSSLNSAGDLRSQLCRAALSVSNNIAEGFERGTTAELLTFLYIARGSAGEVRSMLHFIDRIPAGERSAAQDIKSEMSDLRSETAALRALCESCARQLRAWADKLQNSDIDGQRHFDGEEPAQLRIAKACTSVPGSH